MVVGLVAPELPGSQLQHPIYLHHTGGHAARVQTMGRSHRFWSLLAALIFGDRARLLGGSAAIYFRTVLCPPEKSTFPLKPRGSFDN